MTADRPTGDTRHHARNGSAADISERVRAAAELATAVDLLLTDVVMPGLGGRELADRVAALRPGIAILFMSGYTADVIARKGILEDGVHVIQKPLFLADLAAKLRETVNADA